MSDRWGDSQRDRDELDRHITGNWGEDQFDDDGEEEAMAATVTMTIDEAREALRAGNRLRIVIGEKPDDPTIVLWNSDGMVMCESVAGWSAGVVEPACEIESDYLGSYLDREVEVLAPGVSGWRGGLK